MARVVLVEDNVALRKSLSDCLTVFGHTVSEAGDAAELYRLIGETTFDVAVVDVNLPHHSGFSITQYLSEQTPIAVIITTVRQAVEDRVRAYQSGADIYMAKPWSRRNFPPRSTGFQAGSRQVRDGAVPHRKPGSTRRKR